MNLFIANLLSLTLGGGSVYLLITGTESGWGWLLFGAIITARVSITKKKKSL